MKMYPISAATMAAQKLYSSKLEVWRADFRHKLSESWVEAISLVKQKTNLEEASQF